MPWVRMSDEIERPAGVQLRLTLLACVEQRPACVVELLVQAADELERVARQDLLVALDRYSAYADVVVACGHAGLMPGTAAAQTSPR